MFENLTAEQLLNFDFAMGTGLDLKIVVINLLAMIAGVLAHTFKKMRQEEISFMEYWKNHGLNSMASISAIAGSFFGMLTMAPGAPIYAYFLMAYTGDSMLNKPFTKEESRGLREDLDALGDKLGNHADELKDKLKTHHKACPMKVMGGAALFVVGVLLLLAL